MEENQADPRSVAAERLAYVAWLQFQAQPRPMADQPWRDPRQGQGRALALLKLKPEITQRELTFLLGLSRQASAELLAKLERQGLITRQPSPDDRRVALVQLTQAGRAADQAEGRAGAYDELLDCLDDEEVVRLCDYLGRIIHQLESSLGDQFAARRDQLWQMAAYEGRPGPSQVHPGFPGEPFPGVPGQPHPGGPVPPGFPPGPPPHGFPPGPPRGPFPPAPPARPHPGMPVPPRPPSPPDPFPPMPTHPETPQDWPAEGRSTPGAQPDEPGDGAWPAR